MAASKDKAQALKNSYVDGIIDELGGVSDPAVRMAVREGDQASIHSFPEDGKVGVINDSDPGLYIHSKDKSYLGDTNPNYANPIEGGAAGERRLMDAPEGAQQEGEAYLNDMEQRMGGTGDLARLGPRSLEEFNRRNPSNRAPKEKKIRRRDSSSAGGFDSSNLAGAMGMEQGNTASIVMSRQGMKGINDGDPTMYLYDDVYGKYHDMGQSQRYANPGNGFQPHRGPRDHMRFDKMRQDATFRSWDKQIYGR
jgi:hypothetical protein